MIENVGGDEEVEGDDEHECAAHSAHDNSELSRELVAAEVFNLYSWPGSLIQSQHGDVSRISPASSDQKQDSNQDSENSSDDPDEELDEEETEEGCSIRAGMNFFVLSHG